MDITTPNVARMYDYYIGGKDNFAIDRAAAQKVLEVFPEAPIAARVNRAFIRRAVTYLRGQGIDQFLDIGSGLPTQGNVHEFAAGARVTYMDIDPVVVSHASAILGKAPDVTAVRADLRDPDAIINHPHLGVDLSRPVGLVLAYVLHLVSDEDRPYEVVARLRDAMAPGSYIVISHLAVEGVSEDRLQAGRDLYQSANATIVARPRVEIQRFFDGFEMVEPGLTEMPNWRPEGPIVRYAHGFAGVGRKV